MELYREPDIISQIRILTEAFTSFFLSCKANVRLKPAKIGHGSHSSKIFVLFCLLFVLCRFVYCLCVEMCAVLLPPGGYPTAVNKYMNIISYYDP